MTAAALLCCVAGTCAVGFLAAQEPLHSQTGTAEGDALGICVRAAGDVDKDGVGDFVVGAPGVDGSVADAGAAAVYSGTDWRLLYFLRGVASQGQFGYAVAGAGDTNADGYGDVIVGAPNESTGNGEVIRKGAGRVHVFSGRDGAVLFTVDGASSGDALGWSVAAAGDLDGDGHDDVLLGAPFADVEAGIDAGTVIVCSGKTGKVVHTLSGQSTSERFGWSVASAGDTNGDRVPDFVVGSEGRTERKTITGGAQLFSGRTGRLLRRLRGEHDEAYFGAAVANAGDVDGDGRDDVLVGGWNAEDDEGSRSGSAVVFSGRLGTPLIRVFGNARHDRFGAAVASIGDVDGDGRPDFAVGAPGDARDRQGYVTVFSGRKGETLFTLVGHENGDGFGSSLAGVGDRNEDGVPDVLVGAPSMRAEAFCCFPECGGNSLLGSAVRATTAAGSHSLRAAGPEVPAHEAPSGLRTV